MGSLFAKCLIHTEKYHNAPDALSSGCVPYSPGTGQAKTYRPAKYVISCCLSH